MWNKPRGLEFPSIPTAFVPVTAVYRPNLSFMLRSTALQRREWVKYMRLRNYRERIGKPIKITSHPLVNAELALLRAKLKRAELNNPWRGLIESIDALTADLAIIANPYVE